MEYVYALTAAAAIPCTIFGGMMIAAAAALKANGENPRAVLSMPRTIVRRGQGQGRHFIDGAGH
jgi:hypothetical protein